MTRDLAHLRLCICTPDYVHMINNGGIGTSFAHSASALSKLGAQVTVVYADTIEHLSAADRAAARTKIERAGVRLEFLFEHITADIADQISPGDSLTVASYLAYQWLKLHLFDVVIFPDWRGVGFFSMNAKRQGLAFAHTKFWVQTHSTALWHELNNQSSQFTEFHVRCFLYERKQIEMCDRLVGASHYILEWHKQHGFQFPADAGVVPYLLDPSLVDMADGKDDGRQFGIRIKIDEIVFFGRLEKRKGLQVFLQALQRLAKFHPEWARATTYVFVGKIAVVDGLNSIQFIDRALKGLGLKTMVLPSLSFQEAVAYLKGRNALAVMPSLTDNSPLTVHECIMARIPFIASNAGGTPEIVLEADRADALCEPTAPALAERFLAVLQRGQPLARPAFDQDRDVVPLWVDLLVADAADAQRSTAAASATAPLVTVCVHHQENLRTLRKTLDGLAAQTYRNVAILVVSNGAADTVDLQADLTALYPDLRIATREVPDLSAGEVRNVGIAHAAGPYIIFTDNSHYAHPRQIETFVTAAMNSGCDALTCAAVLISDAEDPADLKAFVALYLPAGCGISLNLFGNSYGDGNAIFRLAALRAIGGFTEDRLSYGAYEAFSALEQAGFRVASVPEPLMCLRHSVASVPPGGSMLGSYYRALRPALKHLPWGTFGDALLVGLSEPLRRSSTMGSHHDDDDPQQILRQASNPIAVSRLLVLRTIRAGRERDAIDQLTTLAAVATTLEPLYYDVLFARLALDGPEGLAPLLGVSPIATLADAVQQALESRHLMGIADALRQIEARRALSSDECYLAGLIQIVAGDPLIGFKRWSTMVRQADLAYATADATISKAIAAGQLRSGVGHFLDYGHAEGRTFGYVAPHWQAFATTSRLMPEGFASRATTLRNGDGRRATDALRALVIAIIAGGSVLAAADLADLALSLAETRYLEENPDVHAAVRAGHLGEGEEHWRLYGNAETRWHLIGRIQDDSLTAAVFKALAFEGASSQTPPEHKLRASPIHAWLH